ncbi:hypothetical protein P9J64_15150 [Deltaproteobacteria bacterium IMCC39524]|nr:hypothetical protein [Deltaproteobacteria bacterium IMCC39524]
MQRQEWLNIDYILERVNWHLSNHAYELIKPYRGKGICYKEGTFWLVDLFGDIILEDVDLSEFGEGYNLLKTAESHEFEEFIANVCDGLLIKAGHDFESSDCDVCDDLRNSAGIRIDDIASGD